MWIAKVQSPVIDNYIELNSRIWSISNQLGVCCSQLKVMYAFACTLAPYFVREMGTFFYHQIM